MEVSKKLDCDLEHCDLSDGLVSTLELSGADIKKSFEEENGVVMRLEIGDDGDACYNTKFFISAENADGASTREEYGAHTSDELEGTMKCINIESCEAHIDEFAWTSVPVEENN